MRKIVIKIVSQFLKTLVKNRDGEEILIAGVPLSTCQRLSLYRPTTKMGRRTLTAILAAAISLIFLASFSLHLSRNFTAGSAASPPPPSLIAAAISNSLRGSLNLAVIELPVPYYHTESVLLPDWEVLVLPQSPLEAPTSAAAVGEAHLSCIFPGGLASPARSIGDGAAFLCSVPLRTRRVRPFLSPLLSFGRDGAAGAFRQQPEMKRWSRLAYESISTASDLIVFAKGINKRQGVNLPANDLRCVFLSGDGAIVASTGVTSSGQEVFRCGHPETAASRISIDIGDSRRPIPSLAPYRPPPSPTAEAGDAPARRRPGLICACTMVNNVAKFLREWVTYHSAVGVDRFLLYDNGSDDGFELAVRDLNRDGFDVRTRFWPWTKTQEAGFSHAIVADGSECEWIAFIDVDEFIFKPDWVRSGKPNRGMIRSITKTNPKVGQVSIGCLDFGPSGQLAHPCGGVTQGYTCRRRAEERHKSLVRPEAVATTLMNSIHHFDLGSGWKTRRLEQREAVVNHYKYQAWEEFRVKFRRRVSAYVVDWREPTNFGSRDRTLGLGFEPVEPNNWAERFCEVNDTRVKDVTQRWFGKLEPRGGHRMAWE
ncbi:UPF0392 protein [Apostasia shenzhenica]|uniref:Glycosyltransferase family 92 protein n=1 Tax=Apostasia shenzhenica TaxID=1088818 RepID=A0A2H9ZWX2_9ASPA|nr:UPF0392 protein [Apostasia shenzhenica]